MKLSALPIMSILGLAAVLWVVPSIGTQGMGTIGERHSHVDRGLVVGADDNRQVAALRHADIAVAATLAR